VKDGPRDVAMGSGELLYYFDTVDVCLLCFITAHCLYYLQSFQSVALNNIGIPAHESIIPFLLDLASISNQVVSKHLVLVLLRLDNLVSDFEC